MAESFENLVDWENEDLAKSLADAVDSYDKQEEEKKTRFSVENDLTKLLEQSQSNATILILYYIKQIDSMLPCVCSVIGNFSNDDGNGKENVTWKQTPAQL